MSKIVWSIVFTVALMLALSDLAPNGMWLQLVMFGAACVGFTALIIHAVVQS